MTEPLRCSRCGRTDTGPFLDVAGSDDVICDDCAREAVVAGRAAILPRDATPDDLRLIEALQDEGG